MRAATFDDRLEAVAGPPGFSVGGASEGIVFGAIEVQPRDGRTLLAVYDADGTLSSHYPSGIITSGGAATATGSFRLQWQGTGVDQSGLRADFQGGAANVTTYAAGGRSAGRHILSSRLPDGLGTVYGDLDGIPRRTSRSVRDTGDGIPLQEIRSVGIAGDITRVAAFAWPRFLTDGEVLMLHHWLARRYNVPIFGGGGA